MHSDSQSIFFPTGVELTVKHIRNGTVLKPIDVNLNYDSNFQQTNYIPKVQILPVCYSDNATIKVAIFLVCNVG